MPKTEIDYSNTIIYKIICKNTTIKDVYVGHTTNFIQRKYAHKQNCVNEKSTNYKCKLYEVIRNNGGWNNWSMEIVGFFNCNDHYEAIKKEHEYSELLHATLNSIEPMPKPKIKIEKDPPSEKKTYYCEICKVKLQNLKCMDIHNQSKKHIKKQTQILDENSAANTNNNIYIDNNNETTQKSPNYCCETCHYKSDNKKDYNKHIFTDKHKKLVSLTPDNYHSNSGYICELCNKGYSSRVGLWYHKKKCMEVKDITLTVNEQSIGCVLDKKPEEDNKISITNNIPMDLILEVIKQSKEIQNVLVEQNKELQAKLLEQNKQLIELAKKPTMVNYNNNNNNNQFNLNFFLNETCKNAMNIQDFISSIKLTTQDFETTGRIGFVDGISRIFINELKRLEVERRPLHCTDVKRETVYVKDNDTWEKENLEKKKLKWAINSIAQLNLNQVQQWQQEYPECKENNTSANTKFNEMAMVALGGFGDEQIKKFDDKIMKNVLKEVVITK
jgi:hypothetical protein